jgi:hypothetical protein
MKGDKLFLLSQNAGQDDPKGPSLVLLPDKSRMCSRECVDTDASLSALNQKVAGLQGLKKVDG